MPSVDEVRATMNKGYAGGTVYKTSLPFDLQRGEKIRQASLGLASDMSCLDLEPITLDVGCGQGGIASFWPHRHVVGIEISDEAVKLARENYPWVDYRCCAVETFQLEECDRPFELVVAQESIEHWTDAKTGLVAIHRVMAKESCLILTTPNRDSLHCRISRKLGLGEPPYCSFDHVHEFGYSELIELVESVGFRLAKSVGVGLLPYWTMESVMGTKIRSLTDRDEEVNTWFNSIAEHAPAEYAFIQCHAFWRA